METSGTPNPDEPKDDTQEGAETPPAGTEAPAEEDAGTGADDAPASGEEEQGGESQGD